MSYKAAQLSKWWRSKSAKRAFARVAAERRKRFKILKETVAQRRTKNEQ
jgi:hypothetical protein